MFGPLEERVEEEIDSGLVSDVCFGAGPEEECHLFSSKAVLALASPVFRAMFFAAHWHGQQGGASSSSSAAAGAPAEAAEAAGRPEAEGGGYRPQQHTYVAVTDVEAGALRCLLRYVSHLDPGLSLDNALHVYRAADKYQIDGLLGACTVFLDERTDPGDVNQMVRMFDIACRLGLESYACWFLEKLGELSRLQTAKLLSADEFLAMHSVSLAALLRFDGFVVDEETLWRTLRRWAELRAAAPQTAAAAAAACAGAPSAAPPGAEPAGRGAASPAATWQEFLVPFKRLIRFPTMRASFFAEEVAQTGVLAAEDAVEVFCHLARVQGRSLEHRGGGARGAGEALEERPACAFRADHRAPQVSWCAAPGAPEAALPAGDEGSLVAEGAAPALAGGAVVLDGRGLHCGPWGPRVVLGGSGTKFHFAFGSVGFSSGRHAWTISWRPLDARGARSGAPGRGGAAGLAREADAAVAAPRGLGGAGAAPASQASPKGGAAALAADRRTSSGAAISGAADRGAAPGGCCGPSAGGPSDELATRFADWPTCIVFGMKQDVHDRRYVPWEGVADGAGGAASAAPSIRFAIVLDFPSRSVTYVADGGERRWAAPLPHSGAVHPVIAASGPHFFQIRYGMHL